MDKRRKEKGTAPFMESLKEKKMNVIIIAAIVVIVIAVIIVAAVFLGKDAKETASDSDTQVSETVSETESVTESYVVPLEEEAYPEIHALIEEYYQALTDGDTEKIKQLSDEVDEETIIYLQKRSGYIEAYQNLVCYTKNGLEENSYVVYASYEIKFKDMDTPVPGVSPYLVYTKEDGSLYIHEGEVDENVNAYLEEISAQDDVVDLMNRVQVEFNEAVVADENLNNYLAQMRENLKVEVGEALAEAESAAAAAQEEADAATVTKAGGEVRATDVVNVRASDSEQAERIGKVQTGEVLKLIESRANGWSKVEYDGKEAFIKSEFLEYLADDTDEKQDEEQQQADAQNENTSSAGEAAASTDLPASGTIKVGDTVNVRESASENADKIGVCYNGDKLEIVMHQADGWTKVKFDGKTGYVKTAVLKVWED
ncbi:MAG: SH3 domain-containing protein [Lachnospiraceae bacterium]|nr:SH3 domain-containing protein [Lachnospiraceae bacterium]